MQRQIWLATAVLMVMVMVASALAPGAVAAPSAKTDAVSTNGVYIVQMVDEPVVAYEGTIKGLKATAPRSGQKINPFSAEVTAYVTYLKGKHDDALAKVGGAKKLYDFAYSFNGFAAKLTPAQAASTPVST